MRDRTHLAIGVGTALTIMRLTGLKSLAAVLEGTGLAILGYLLPDIDVSRSTASTNAKAALKIGAGIIGVGVAIKRNYNIDLNFTGEDANKVIMATIIGVILTILGSRTPHRSFTHSLLGIGLFSIPIYMLAGSSALWFAIGYGMHIVADLFNKRKVRVLYPRKKGLCFNLCKSNGLMDTIIMLIFTAISSVQYVEFIVEYIGEFADIGEFYK